MEGVLRQINTVPGVIGSLVCDENGSLNAYSFPALFDATMMEEASVALAESSFGLQGGAGAVGMLDLRYGEGRIIVKSLPGAFLMLLCAKTLNLQLLLISLNVAMKKLENLLAAPRTAAVPAAAAQATQTIDYDNPYAAPLKLIERVGDKGLKLSVDLLKSSAGTYWDQMNNVVAINRETARQLSDFFKTGSFKKLKLTNQITGHTKSFPVRIIADDRDRSFAGRIVISLAVAESLHVRVGESLLASLNLGGGIFGWEGI